MRISLVVAVADNGVIGREGALPWHLPADLQHFRRVTWGKPVLMGRRTYESIGRALPGRRNLVLSRHEPPAGAPVEFVRSWDEALRAVRDAPELCVIGGSELYRLAMPMAERLYLTQVHGQVTGDTRFGPLVPAEWAEQAREEHPSDERHAWPMTFLTLDRRAAGTTAQQEAPHG